MNTLLHKYRETFSEYKLLFNSFSKELTFDKAMLAKCRQYVTLYRALLLLMLVPGIVLWFTNRELRNIFFMIWGSLAILTYIVESGLFIFQFTRKENFYVELITLPVAMTGAFIMI